ncbi:MAG: hypothetical protein IPK68_14510 [Bdellovibrionales bacterium]|nr:hypothetical protein [Bdellovibrionales bacterium]
MRMVDVFLIVQRALSMLIFCVPVFASLSYASGSNSLVLNGQDFPQMPVVAGSQGSCRGILGIAVHPIFTFVSSNGLKKWFEKIDHEFAYNRQISENEVAELLERFKNYSEDIDNLLGSPQFTVAQKLKVILYNLAYLSKWENKFVGSDLSRRPEHLAAHFFEGNPVIIDFIVRQIQWLQQPAFIELILRTYQQFDQFIQHRGAGPHLDYFGRYNDQSDIPMDESRFDVSSFESLLAILLQPHRGPKVVGETMMLIYGIYSRSDYFQVRRPLPYKMAPVEVAAKSSKPSSRVPDHLPGVHLLIEGVLQPALLNHKTHPLITLFFMQIEFGLFGSLVQPNHTFDRFYPEFASNDYSEFGVEKAKSNFSLIWLKLLEPMLLNNSEVTEQVDLMLDSLSFSGQSHLDTLDELFLKNPNFHMIVKDRLTVTPTNHDAVIVSGLPIHLARALIISSFIFRSNHEYQSQPENLRKRMPQSFHLLRRVDGDEQNGQELSLEGRASFDFEALRDTLGILRPVPTSATLDVGATEKEMAPIGSTRVNRSSAPSANSSVQRVNLKGNRTIEFLKRLSREAPWPFNHVLFISDASEGKRSPLRLSPPNGNSPVYPKISHDFKRADLISPILIKGNELLASLRDVGISCFKLTKSRDSDPESSVDSVREIHRFNQVAFDLSTVLQSGIGRIRDQLNEVYRWAMDIDNGIVHRINSLNRPWKRKVSEIDVSELRQVLDQLAETMQSTTQIENLSRQLASVLDEFNSQGTEGPLRSNTMREFVKANENHLAETRKVFQRTSEMYDVMTAIQNALTFFEPGRDELERLRSRMFKIAP